MEFHGICKEEVILEQGTVIINGNAKLAVIAKGVLKGIRIFDDLQFRSTIYIGETWH